MLKPICSTEREAPSPVKSTSKLTYQQLVLLLTYGVCVGGGGWRFSIS